MPERLLAPLTIFLGALLLFAVEPLIAKMILPWFGGSAGVWIACLMFFQAALFAGYLYAHLLTARLAAVWQWRVHLLLLAVSLVFLPIAPAEKWKPEGVEEPLPLILALLAGTIGLPFLLLAATGPLVQSWLSRSMRGDHPPSRSVYRLYALSNLGSLIALLSYPVLIEPWLPTRMQAWAWSLFYFVFALLSAATAWRYGSAKPKPDSAHADAGPQPKLAERLIWFLLAMMGSALLVAVTNFILRNIAAIPLLWVLPLGLYLLSFIVSFDNPRWYYRPLWYALFAAASGIVTYSAIATILPGNYVAQLAFYSAALFACCMVCHGELALLKPAPAYLTGFYLIVAGGGAAGGLFVAALAPLLFSGDYDLSLITPMAVLLLVVVVWRRVPAATPSWVRWTALALPLYLWAYVIGSLAIAARAELDGHVASVRNFYGPLRVTLRPGSGTAGEMIQLRNGNIIHGREFTAAGKRCRPISYYGQDSGIGATLQEMRSGAPLQIGVIGLGAGMIAGYGQRGDVFRFYEINPLVRDIAARFFYYLSCAGQSSITMGDARLSLQREAPQNFDVLAVDAFSSDAIPVHLLTLEAFELYWRHLKPDGVLAVHVSNHYIDLAPIVALAAERSGKTARVMYNVSNEAEALDTSLWVLVTSRPGFFAKAPLAQATTIAVPKGVLPWTDDYSNLWQVLR